MLAPFNLKTDQRGQEKQKEPSNHQLAEAAFKAKAMPNYKFFEVKHENSQDKK